MKPSRSEFSADVGSGEFGRRPSARRISVAGIAGVSLKERRRKRKRGGGGGIGGGRDGHIVACPKLVEKRVTDPRMDLRTK